MTTFILAQKHGTDQNSPFFVHTHTHTHPPLPFKNKGKDEAVKPFTVCVILLLASALPNLLFQAPDDSHDQDSALWPRRGLGWPWALALPCTSVWHTEVTVLISHTQTCPPCSRHYKQLGAKHGRRPDPLSSPHPRWYRTQLQPLNTTKKAK